MIQKCFRFNIKMFLLKHLCLAFFTLASAKLNIWLGPNKEQCGKNQPVLFADQLQNWPKEACSLTVNNEGVVLPLSSKEKQGKSITTDGYTSPVPQKSTGVSQESTGQPQESTGVTQESTRVTQESTRVTQESTGVTQESTGAPQESTGLPQESTGFTDEHTNTKDASSYDSLLSKTGGKTIRKIFY